MKNINISTPYHGHKKSGDPMGRRKYKKHDRLFIEMICSASFSHADFSVFSH